MTNSESLFADAIVAGWAQSIQALPARFPSTTNGKSLVCLFEERMSIALKSSIPDNHFLVDILRDTKNVQFQLILECTKHTLSKSIQVLKSKRDRTRLRSLQGRDIELSLHAIHTSTKFAVNSGDNHLAIRVRMECRMPLSSLLRQ